MLVAGFPTGAFQANCYLIAAAAGRECVIVDAGQDAYGPITEAVREHDLTPVAVLATHGHFDHVATAEPVAREYRIPVWIDPADRDLLAEPLRGIGPELAGALGEAVTRQLRGLVEPADVRELDGRALELAGLRIGVLRTPGHTPGSVVFRLEAAEGGKLALTGDTLFAGSIGRTDLPGGDSRQIARSLRETVLTLDDETVVLPGHGPSTTIGRERATNPFLSAEARRARA